MRERKDLLVVIESVNFNGGAHVATWAMIDALVARGWRIDVMTASEPTDAMRRRLHLGWVPNWTIDPTGAVRRDASRISWTR